MELKKGDTVTVKGYKYPIMTINSINSSLVDCVWFDSSLKLRNGFFNKEILIKSDNTKKINPVNLYKPID